MTNTLERFIVAQSTTYAEALNEIKNGSKLSHWMWYIFPQFKGLGRSSTSVYYAINRADEAQSYYKHPVLGARLREISDIFLSIDNKSALDILGTPDYFKMKSCMTLFHSVQEDTFIFHSI